MYAYLDRLPPWGFYKSQLALDEDWARMILDREEAGLDSPPTGEDDDGISPLGYTDVIGRLDLLLDRVQSLESAVIWTINPKEQRASIKPMPRPETAIDRERERRARRILEDVDAMFRGEGLILTFE